MAEGWCICEFLVVLRKGLGGLGQGFGSKSWVRGFWFRVKD